METGQRLCFATCADIMLPLPHHLLIHSAAILLCWQRFDEMKGKWIDSISVFFCLERKEIASFVHHIPSISPSTVDISVSPHVFLLCWLHLSWWFFFFLDFPIYLNPDMCEEPSYKLFGNETMKSVCVDAVFLPVCRFKSRKMKVHPCFLLGQKWFKYNRS